MKEIIENIKHKSKIEKVMLVIMAVSAISLVASAFLPLLYLTP